MSASSQQEQPILSEELELKSTSYTRKSLEPIKEESVCSSTDLKSRSKRSSRNDSKTLTPLRTSKVCPATQGECPTKKKIAERKFKSQAGGSQISFNVSDTSTNKSYSSLLERPFIFRRSTSLQKAIEKEERDVKLYLKASLLESAIDETPIDAHSVPSSTTVTTTEYERDRFSDSKSQTDTTELSYTSIEKHKLEYLLGLPTSGEGEYESKARKADVIDNVLVDEKLEKSLTGETEAMRQAQRYLRVHRIFEFYQFLVAHLLSALPENPINFLLDLLDKCIVYRAGMGSPPVLYDRKHLDALFNLMDRMRTGYIDKDQYATGSYGAGMKTLGICSYNEDPVMTDNMVPKSFFIEEAYENLVSMLNDIIRRRWIYFNCQPSPIKTPPPTPMFSTPSEKTHVSSKHKAKTIL